MRLDTCSPDAGQFVGALVTVMRRTSNLGLTVAVFSPESSMSTIFLGMKDNNAA